MNQPFLRAAGMALLPAALAACTAPAPYVDAHLGEALMDMQKAQTLNPGASRNMAQPSVGVASPIAKSGFEQYQKSYKNPEVRSNAFTIGLGK